MRTRLHRLWRGPDSDPAWCRPALLVLLGATATLYVWGLGASGWANSFYSAAVQAGTRSWKAFFFGSSDASNFITVDKTPASLWVMELSARLFGVNSWSILVPQALEGVATVGLLYTTIKRWFSPAAALLAGAVCALTPVAVLMFRFNNPDALLTLLLTASAYAMTRALEQARTRWLVLAGVAVGFAFLTKELQAFLVLPALGLVYLVAAPTTLRRRFAHLCVLTASVIASAGWWIAAVVLTPASSRPYIGGSQNNSFWNVLFGYNGFGRLTGNESGSVGGAARGAGGGQWGPTGLTRLFNADFGAQVSWLLPAALVLLIGGLALTWTRARTDRTRAALLMWGGILLVSGVAFSLGQGIIHPYYTVALAPVIGALVAIGGEVAWRRRQEVAARLVLAVAMGATAWWASRLLSRTPTWHPGLRSFVIAGGVLAVTALVAMPRARSRASTRIGTMTAIAATVVALAAPAGYALSTAATPHGGAIPSAGPTNARIGGFPGGGFRRRFTGRFPNGATGPNFAAGPNFAGGPPNAGNAPQPGTSGRGGVGGLLEGSRPSAALTKLLESGAAGYRWAAATVGANNAAGYQLASGTPVMAIGGFNGTDPTPTLAQFEQYVAAHKIHYFIGGGAGGPGSSADAAAITSWVTRHFTAQTVDGVTIYDLTAASSTSG